MFGLFPPACLSDVPRRGEREAGLHVVQVGPVLGIRHSGSLTP